MAYSWACEGRLSESDTVTQEERSEKERCQINALCSMHAIKERGDHKVINACDGVSRGRERPSRRCWTR